MRITFRRFPDHGRAYSVIERDDGVVYQMIEFTRPGTELPHDLRHLVVERELGIADGTWGGIAAGLVYPSMEQVRGRRPPHSADQCDEPQRAQRQRLIRAEMLANLVEVIAILDDPSDEEIRRLARMKLPVMPVMPVVPVAPVVPPAEPGANPSAVVALPPQALAAAARALAVEAARWARLRVGEELVYEWRFAIPAAVRALPRQRDGRDDATAPAGSSAAAGSPAPAGSPAAAGSPAPAGPPADANPLGGRWVMYPVMGDQVRAEDRELPEDRELMALALRQGRASLEAGGVPVGAVLAVGREVIAAGHNERVQQGDPVAHGEISALRNAGRRASYADTTLYTTLSPCQMCTGAILLFQIPRVVVGEARTFEGDLDFLRAKGVEIVLLDDPGCIAAMEEFQARYPQVWSEDIGGR